MDELDQELKEREADLKEIIKANESEENILLAERKKIEDQVKSRMFRFIWELEKPKRQGCFYYQKICMFWLSQHSTITKAIGNKKKCQDFYVWVLWQNPYFTGNCRWGWSTLIILKGVYWIQVLNFVYSTHWFTQCLYLLYATNNQVIGRIGSDVNSLLKNNLIIQSGQLLSDLSGGGKSELHRTRCRVTPGS